MRNCAIIAAALISLTAATLPSASMANGSVTINELPAGMSCFDVGSPELKCSTQSQRDAYFKKAILPFLKKSGYPSKIVVNDAAEMKAVKAGWKKTGACETIHPTAVTNYPRVNEAKIIFCKLRSAGFNVPKPQIVADYR